VTPILALALVQAAAAPAGPAPTPASPAEAQARFQQCAAEARTAPEAAVEAANAWRIEGGRLDAQQCLGLAYVGLGRWRSAATVYEQAAREAEAAQDIRRADFWVQSGNAWLAAEEGTRAVQAFDSALATGQLGDEMRGEVHLDRARALVSLGSAEAARGDLDRALLLVPSDPFAWYLSAGLARRQNDMARAATDIARARELAPNDPDILLLAGTLAGLAGNGAEAERLYRQVATSAPDTDSGRAAAAALATMADAPAPAPAPVPAPAPETSQPPAQAGQPR
jgi:tetratricopeptide (TPR) repeat protein